MLCLIRRISDKAQPNALRLLGRLIRGRFTHTMFLAILAAALQTAPAFQPVLTPGVSPEFSHAVQIIATLTQAKDFAGAGAALRLLPSPDVKVEWHDEAVQKSSRFDFGQQRDAVFKLWARVTAGSFKLVPSGGDIRVDFVAGSGSKLIWSEDSQQSRLTVAIGLGNDKNPADPVAVFNDMSYAVGAYCGISKLPLPGLLMAGVDDATDR